MSTARLGGLLLAGLWISWLAQASIARAHEVRPAYLEINEQTENRYEILFRTPVLYGVRLPVELKFPFGVRNVTAPALRQLPDVFIERRLIDAPGGLSGKRIEFAGLGSSFTDVLVRVQTLDGERATVLVHPSEPWVEIPQPRGPLAVAGAYLVHGIEHILLGYDHLLFVLALILIVPSGRVLLVTITTFTIAHSITLALATLGVVRVPAAPVEATIALSILLLACEIRRLDRGQPSVTARWPWIVAFSFGLLHGFGFASALVEVGLPSREVPLALLMFNVGVELGQLAFIGVVLGAWSLLKRIRLPARLQTRSHAVATYAIGSLAAFWLMERVAEFWP